MKTFIKNFIADESGASAAEYALIIAVVGVGIGAAALTLGNNVTNAVGNAANDVNACNSNTTKTGGTSVEWKAGDAC
jgi:pilus assembly protein Flp/PilA